MSDYLFIRKEVERKVGRREFKKIIKELGYMLFYYSLGAYLPYNIQKKLFKEKIKKYDPFKSTFINSCMLIGASIPLLFSGDVTLFYQTMINWRYIVGFSFSIPAYFFRSIGVYLFVTNPLRILYAFIKKNRVGDVLMEGVNYARNEIPRIIAKHFSKKYEKEIEEKLRQAILFEKKRRELEEKIEKIEKEIKRANEEYFKRKHERDK